MSRSTIHRISSFVAVLAAVTAAGGCKGTRPAGTASTERPPAGAKLERAASTGAAFAAVPTEAAAPAGEAIPIAALPRATTDGVQLRGFGGGEASGFRVTYVPSPQPAHARIEQVFQQARVLDLMAEALNRTVRVPTVVEMTMLDCNAVNAYYDPGTKRVMLCNELVAHFIGAFKSKVKTDDELGNAVIGATMFALIHEIGHGLIDLLALPAVGREEDSVDQLATLILLAGGEQGVGMALAGAYWFQMQSQATGEKLPPYWDEHAFDGQRYYNVLCLLYGANPQKHADMVSDQHLPKDRAARCAEEHRKISAAWEKLLQPHLTGSAAANVDYTPPAPPVAEPIEDTSTDDGIVGEEPPGGSAPGTCEAVADQISELVAVDAVTRAGGEVTDAIERQLETQLPAVMQQALARCTQEKWSEAVRACVLRAETLAAANACNPPPSSAPAP